MPSRSRFRSAASPSRLLAALTAMLAIASAADAEPSSAETRSVPLAGGALVIEAPAAWSDAEAANRLIERELRVDAPAGSDAGPARFTAMSAGGSIDANIARWVGQFRGTEGGADRSAAKIDKSTAGGMNVTVIDVSGEYLESMGGPFGPKTPRPGYRMLAAIVETGTVGNYFLKLVGPEATVSAAADGFREMISSCRKP